MGKRSDGKELEKQVQFFFENLLSECGYTIHKGRIQNSGTQDGMDNEIITIDDKYNRHKIYLECKDYSSKLSYSEAVVKIPQIISSYKPSILIFISPKKPFNNPYNDTRLSDFYDQFNVPIEFLTPDNKVEELIALNESLYKLIYGREVDFKIDRKEKLRDFKRFVFSTKPLKKIVLDEDDRIEYITNITKNGMYTKRRVSEVNNNEGLFNTDTFDLKEKLVSEFRRGHKGYVLIGNPGLGKSSELKNLAINLWEDKNREFVPFFRSLNTFVINNNIEDFLPKEWRHIPNLLVIYDGLDEVSDVQNFKSKLSKFIADSNSTINFILSCRSSLYENTIKEISEMECVVLEELYFHEVYSYLEKKYSIKRCDVDRVILDRNQMEFLKNPYYLDLFGENFNNGNVILNKCGLIEAYVSKRLEDDRIKKYNNKDYDKSLVLNICKKVALSMEAMQINIIEDMYLSVLLEQNKKLFTNCCFVEKVLGENSWKFEHRNLQEYFVADALSKLTFEKIIEFISINGDDKKIHPSWVNSVSYLLNILNEESESYKEIVNWFEINQIEVLFKLDSDRVNWNLRIELFQKYYTEVCKKQTLFITDFDYLEIAKFGNSIENIDFLLAEILDFSINERTRSSALSLLSKMELSSRKKEFKNTALKLLSASIDKVDFRFKGDLLDAIRKLNYHIEDDGCVDEIIKALGCFDYHFITSSMIKILNDVRVEKYLNYLKEITPKILDDNKRNYTKSDNYANFSEQENLKDILLGFEDLISLSFTLEILMDSRNIYSLSLKDEEIKSIITKLVKLFQSGNDEVYSFIINKVKTGLSKVGSFYHCEDMIVDFFIETNTKTRCFYELLGSEQIKFEDKRRVLVRLFTDNESCMIVDHYKSGYVSVAEIIYFRNNLSCHDYELAKLFQEKVISATDINFDGELLSDEINLKWRTFHETNPRLDFDLLFDKKLILDKFSDYMLFTSKDVITRIDLKDDKKDFREDVDLRKRFPNSFFQILYSAINAYVGGVSYDDVKEFINSDLNLIRKIYGHIYSENLKFEIQQKHKDYIENWCLNNLSKAVFNKLCNCVSNEERCKFLWFFKNKYEFDYPESYLLDLLNMDGKLKHNEQDVGHDYIIKTVGIDKVLERIEQNMSHQCINKYVFYKQAKIALDYDFVKSYKYIREFILDEKNDYLSYRSNLLSLYVQKNKDVNLLKSLINLNPNEINNDGISWEALKILIVFRETDFVIDKLLEFNSINKVVEKELRIIKYLFLSKYGKSTKLLLDFMRNNFSYFKKEFHYSFASDDWVGYNSLESVDDAIEIMRLDLLGFKIREDENPSRIGSSILIKICQKNKAEDCLDILKKVENFELRVREESFDKFYIYKLIKDIKDVYIKHKSKPLRFADVVQKIDEIKYEII